MCLLAQARTDDTDTHLQAVIALRHLSLHPKNRLDVVALGGLEPLLELLRLPAAPIEVPREVAACLRNLSLSETNKVLPCRGVALAAVWTSTAAFMCCLLSGR